jgi:hypothetical protein
VRVSAVFGPEKHTPPGHNDVTRGCPYPARNGLGMAMAASNGLRTLLARADAYETVDPGNPDLSVSDLS